MVVPLHTETWGLLSSDCTWHQNDWPACRVLKGVLTCRLNEDCNSIQNAISEKVGNTLHHLATFLVGIAIG